MRPRAAKLPSLCASSKSNKAVQSWFEIVSSALESGEVVRITKTEQQNPEFEKLVEGYGTIERPIERDIGKRWYFSVVENGPFYTLKLMALPEQPIWDWAAERRPLRPSEAKNRRVVFPLIAVECMNCGAFLEVHFDVQESCDSCGAITYQRMWWAWNPALSEWCRIDEIEV